MTPIVTAPAHSLTLQRLIENLEVVNGRLDDATLWSAAEIGEQYIRVEAGDSLVSTGPQRREYAVAVHIFATPVSGHMHDHRWPLAVYPFAAGLADGTPLYEMPWEDGRHTGVLTVRSRYPYAIEKCSARHAVHGRRPHMSLTFTDVTDPPTRPNRLSITPLSAQVTAAVLAYARDAFRAAGGS